jgi:hypothetical protein
MPAIVARRSGYCFSYDPMDAKRAVNTASLGICVPLLLAAFTSAASSV